MGERVCLAANTFQINEDLVSSYGYALQDLNPIHFDDKAAEDAGYPAKVAHGMILMTLAQKTITLKEVGWFASMYEARFTAPVFVGERIFIEPVMLSEEESMMQFRIEAQNRGGKKVLDGFVVFTKRSST
ncbi:MaoC family dehydratase [Bacillus solitudinis]|uniref:MaoC family dehydratase n=1 Tax=Bacillus solitudinis TaxID=2014074 RepID=UPI000C250683|nr:MaoC family dehydratase [Bacillus solitudinis]